MVDVHDPEPDVIDLLSDRGEVGRVECGPDLARRVMHPSAGVTIISDRIDGSGSELRFARIRVDRGAGRVSLGLDRSTASIHSLRRGFLLRVHRQGRDLSLWFPRSPFLARFDDRGRVKLSGKRVTWDFVNLDRNAQVTINTDGASQDELCMSYVIVTDERAKFDEEAIGLSDMWHSPLFKSDWFAARSPLDLWDYLIDGEIYDPRPSLVGGGRFRCQQCALAWWSYLQGMNKSTGLGLFRLLAREVAWSVRADLRKNGEWVHGFWCEPPETHLRFVFDGLHLLISEGETSSESEWIIDTEKAMESVILKFTDSLDEDGIWFLHDSLELDAAAPTTGSRVFGAASGNTLCLNTHIQALTVLNRLRSKAEAVHSQTLESVYQGGLSALERVLGLRPAELLFRFLGMCIVPAVTSKKKPGLPARLQRVLFFRFLRRPYWWVRGVFRRVVYPNGFIERDMSSAMLADDYLVLNLKDLLMLYAQDSQVWMEPVVKRGVDFLTRLDLAAGLDRSSLFMEAVEVYRLAGFLIDQRYNEMADRAEVAIQGFNGGSLLEDALLWTVDLRQEQGGPTDSPQPGDSPTIKQNPNS